MKGLKKALAALLAAAVMFTGTVPATAMRAEAATRYGEDQPLTSRRKLKLTVRSGHKHSYIDASNGVRYQLYCSCMSGMKRSTPTNHSSTVKIDGVTYTLGNYAYSGKSCSYANVIRKVSGSTSTSKNVPLTYVSLTKSSLTLTVGSSYSLGVIYRPANTTVSKTVTWKSSNTSIATVSSGIVKAKKAGTVTITGKMGSKSATCKVTVKAKTSTGSKSSTSSSKSSTSSSSSSKNGTYANASAAYTALNKFRTTGSVWVWNKNNRTKTYYNKSGCTTLRKLTRDTKLENAAKIRAKEIATKFSHTRPNGSYCSTVAPSGYYYLENIAMGTSSIMSAERAVELWKETAEQYSGQGHRRTMLDTRATRVGIAGYTANGCTYWVMCVGWAK